MRSYRLLALAVSTGLLFSVFFFSCATAKRSDSARSISKFVAYELRFRRPSGIGADPSAGPGGEDYRSSVPVGSNLDCELPEASFKGREIGKIRECLKSIEKPVKLRYQLRREAQPFLRLEDGEGTPACVKQLLAQIPVPREIFFQSDEEGSMLCYSSRLDIEADEVLGAKVPTNRVHVTLELPSEEPPKDDREMLLYLSSVAMGPFWSSGPKKTLRSHVVPRYICEQCFGKGGVLPSDGRPRVYWP